MKKISFSILFLAFLFCFSACKNDDEVIAPPNAKAEFFKRITDENQINKVMIYKSNPNAPTSISTRNYYDYPGNNFMRIGNLYDGQFSGTSYNLDRVIWYQLDETKYANGDIDRTLKIEFDQ